MDDKSIFLIKKKPTEHPRFSCCRYDYYNMIFQSILFLKKIRLWGWFSAMLKSGPPAVHFHWFSTVLIHLLKQMGKILISTTTFPSK